MTENAPSPDPDYCRCGATVRLVDSMGTMSVYHPAQMAISHLDHRHEWTADKPLPARHVEALS